MATQMSKTASLLNIAGRKLDDDPQPVLYIGPTKSNLESVIEPQVSAMLQDVSSLRAKSPPGKRQKKMLKRIGSVTLRLAWANSPTELASQPAHTVIVDERDKMGPIKGEGDPVELAIARVATYPDAKVITTSSPTEGTVTSTVHPETGLEHWDPADPQDVPSPIWRAWQEGTRHEWAIPCQHCSRYFIPRFKLLKWPDGATPRQASREARLACPNCGGLMDESHKARMNEAGRAVAPGQRVVDGQVVGEAPDTDIFSLWVSGLMSPWVTFGQRAAAWLRAAASGDQERIRSQINTRFGELYQLRGQAPAWQSVKDLGDKDGAAPYRLRDIPKGVRVLFLTADVQKDRLVCVVRGWGPEFASWLIHTEELWGDTDQPEVYARLRQISERKFGELPIRACAVDSGYRTEKVYEWVFSRGAHAYATKGRDNPTKLYGATDVEVDTNGKKRFAGMKLWTLDHSYFKGWVHDRLVWPQDQPGAWHLPADVTDDYCKQIVGEQRMRLPSGKTQWVKSGPNDWLDAEALQVFLAHVEGVRYLSAEPVSQSRADRIAERARQLNG